MRNLQTVIYEGWTIKNFIDELEFIFNMIQNGQSYIKKFENKKQIIDWCKSEQPHHKKRIKEVENYFITKAGF